MVKFCAVLCVLFLLFSVAACAPSSNEFAQKRSENEEIAGFWKGLWHGIIAPVTFIISLFNEKVGMYEVHHVKGWYDFGFLLGAMIILGGGSGSAGRTTCRRRD